MKKARKMTLFLTMVMCFTMVLGMTVSAASQDSRTVAGMQVTGVSQKGNYYGWGQTSYPASASLTVDVGYTYIHGTGNGEAYTSKAYTGDRTTVVSATANKKAEHTVNIRNTSVSSTHYVNYNGQSASFSTNVN